MRQDYQQIVNHDYEYDEEEITSLTNEAIEFDQAQALRNNYPNKTLKTRKKRRILLGALLLLIAVIFVIRRQKKLPGEVEEQYRVRNDDSEDGHSWDDLSYNEKHKNATKSNDKDEDEDDGGAKKQKHDHKSDSADNNGKNSTDVSKEDDVKEEQHDHNNGSTENNDKNSTDVSKHDQKNIDQAKAYFEASNHTVGDGLRVALFLTFPNSGTSYTLSNTRQSTLTSHATNYCDGGGDRYPVFTDADYGPIYEGHFYKYAFPKKYILTKTHCTGRCTMCGPDEYVIHDDKTFREGCLVVSDCRPGHEEHPPITLAQYAAYESLIEKTVHIVRNPFDNIIARFHLTLKSKHINYANNMTGFISYCEHQNKSYEKKNREFFGDKFDKYVKRIPCYADFYRYIQWHNYAIRAIQYWNKPSLSFYYEDYETKYNKTVMSLANHLEQDWISNGKPYHASVYSNYYTDEQVKAVKEMVSDYASNDTMHQLERYGFSFS